MIANCGSFMLLYFTFEELLPQIAKGKLNYQELSLSELQKREMLSYILNQNKVPESMIEMFHDFHFEIMLGGDKSNNQNYVADVVPLMTKYKDLF